MNITFCNKKYAYNKMSWLSLRLSPIKYVDTNLSLYMSYIYTLNWTVLQNDIPIYCYPIKKLSLFQLLPRKNETPIYRLFSSAKHVAM